MRWHLTRVVAFAGLLLSASACEPKVVDVQPCPPDCGGDAGPVFPPLAAEVMAEFCIRGKLWPSGGATGSELAPSSSVTGTVDEDDCTNPDLPGSGYFEVWRVRVTESGLVTFRVSSDFDSYLELVRINDIADYANSIVYVGYNDDGAGNLQPRLVCQLAPDVEYALAVSGLWDGATGPYVLDSSPGGGQFCPG